MDSKRELNPKEWITGLRPINDQNNPPLIYQLKASRYEQRNHKLQILYYGQSTKTQEKTILLLGQTGSGKTTIINAMMNYIAGVQFHHDFRLQLDEEHDLEASTTKSLSDETKVYKIYNSRLPYTLNIIDTPGISDNQDVSRDRRIISSIQQLTNTEFGRIDVICLVINSTIVRMTEEQKYVLHQIASIFEEDMSAKTFVLGNRALSDNAVVLEGLKEVGFNHSGHFLFENGSIFCNKGSTKRKTEKFREYFEDGHESFERFFMKLNKVEVVSDMKTVTSMINKNEKNTKGLAQRDIEITKQSSSQKSTLDDKVCELNVKIAKVDEYIAKETRRRTEFEVLKRENENYKNSIRKEYRTERTPDYSVLNCQKCMKTCCSASHDGILTCLSQLRLNAILNMCWWNCVVGDTCSECSCPYDHHNKSRNIQYSVDTRQELEIIPEKKRKFDEADESLNDCDRKLNQLKKNQAELKSQMNELNREMRRIQM